MSPVTLYFILNKFWLKATWQSFDSTSYNPLTDRWALARGFVFGEVVVCTQTPLHRKARGLSKYYYNATKCKQSTCPSCFREQWTSALSLCIRSVSSNTGFDVGVRLSKWTELFGESGRSADSVSSWKGKVTLWLKREVSWLCFKLERKGNSVAKARGQLIVF